MTPKAVTPPPRLFDTGIDLQPSPDRTVLRFFVPGHEDVGPGDSRAGPVIERLLALSEAEVVAALGQIEHWYSSRHASLHRVLDVHAEMVSHRLHHASSLSAARRRLLGATFTHEYSIEGAALCNPSIVRHPLQPGDGTTRFVMSVRGVGEGHRSSIGFRTGAVHRNGSVTIDEPLANPVLGAVGPGSHDRGVLHRKLAELGDDHENAAYVLDQLPEHFDEAQLVARIAALAADASTRRHTDLTIANLHQLAACSYLVTFDDSVAISERVLWPRSPVELHGMEDARFVEIADTSAPRYCATYTAFDGTHIGLNLLTTDDFLTFSVTPLAGNAATGKGMALFPRRVHGRYAALSRADRESNSISYSNNLHCWDESTVLQTARAPWEVIQLGNCGSPIETADGWLVLTHGVGPMRTYSIGAILLDLDEPHRLVAYTPEPIITPPHHGGYVPNVVYTCGALLVDELLVVPYGVGDRSISIATFKVGEVIGSMRRVDDRR